MSDYYYGGSYYDSGYSDFGTGLALLSIFGVAMLVMFVVCVISIICYWKLFTKAGKPGWTALIPFYNSYKVFELIFGVGYGYLAFVPLAMIIVNFIPIIGQLVSIVVYCVYIFGVPIMLVKRYGASTAFGIGAIFFPVIFFPILAFSNVYQYIGPIGYAPFNIPPLGGNTGYVGGDTGYNEQTGYYGQNPNGYQNRYNQNGGQTNGQAPNNWNDNYSQGYQGQYQNGRQQVNLNKDEFNEYGQRPQNGGSQYRPQNGGSQYRPQGNMGQNPMGQRPYQNPMGQNPMSQRPYQNSQGNMGQNPMGQRPQGYRPNGQGQNPQNFNGYNQNNEF